MAAKSHQVRHGGKPAAMPITPGRAGRPENWPTHDFRMNARA